MSFDVVVSRRHSDLLFVISDHFFLLLLLFVSRTPPPSLLLLRFSTGSRQHVLAVVMVMLGVTSSCTLEAAIWLLSVVVDAGFDVY